MSYPLRAGGREVAGAVDRRGAHRRGRDRRPALGRGARLRDRAEPGRRAGAAGQRPAAADVGGLAGPAGGGHRRRGAGRRSGSPTCAARCGCWSRPSPYALGTSDAPMLVTIGNGLPFTVQVRLEISSTSGLRVAPIEMQQVPPLGRRQARVSAQVTRSGQFTVQAAVRSPDGRAARPAEPAAGAVHRLRHDHGVADGERGRPAGGAGGPPGAAPGARRAAPAHRADPGGPADPGGRRDPGAGRRRTGRCRRPPPAPPAPAPRPGPPPDRCPGRHRRTADPCPEAAAASPHRVDRPASAGDPIPTAAGSAPRSRRTPTEPVRPTAPGSPAEPATPAPPTARRHPPASRPDPSPGGGPRSTTADPVTEEPPAAGGRRAGASRRSAGPAA